jgi:hypothetical protein
MRTFASHLILQLTTRDEHGLRFNEPKYVHVQSDAENFENICEMWGA